MTLRIFFIAFVVCFITSNNLFAQFKEEFTPGIRMGANYSNITGVRSTLLTINSRPNTIDNTPAIETFTEENRLGYVGGLFFNYKLTDRSPYFAIQGEVDFSMHGGKYRYDSPKYVDQKNDTINALNYNLTFRYNYLTFGGMFKYYPLNNGFNVGIGPRLGFNLTRDNIFYSSNTPQVDLSSQQNYRQALRGVIDFSFNTGIGFEFPFGTTIDARYIIGVTDAIEVGPNDFSWLETENRTNLFQLTIGHKIPFFEE